MWCGVSSVLWTAVDDHRFDWAGVGVRDDSLRFLPATRDQVPQFPLLGEHSTLPSAATSSSAKRLCVQVHVWTAFIIFIMCITDASSLVSRIRVFFVVWPVFAYLQDNLM